MGATWSFVQAAVRSLIFSGAPVSSGLDNLFAECGCVYRILIAFMGCSDRLAAGPYVPCETDEAAYSPSSWPKYLTGCWISEVDAHAAALCSAVIQRTIWPGSRSTGKCSTHQLLQPCWIGVINRGTRTSYPKSLMGCSDRLAAGPSAMRHR